MKKPFTAILSTGQKIKNQILKIMGTLQAISEILKQEPANTSQKAPEVIDYSNEAAVQEYLSKEFPGINPSPVDFFKGKLQAYKLAVERSAREEKEAKIKERQLSFTQMWTPKQMAAQAFQAGKAIGIAQGFDFVIDQYNKDVFELLCLYFTNDPQFEERGIGDKKYSLKKGIWLQSSTRGSGKSVLLRCFYLNKRSCFGYKHTTELAAMFQKNSFDGVDNYIGTMPQSPSPLNFYQSECGFMYDELFGEEKVMHMGSPLLLSSYILNKLYDFSSNYRDRKWKFHCTSNAAGEDIEAIAGKTFRSRMPDMFNLIKLEGPDRR
jgi:hypothetical protein